MKPIFVKLGRSVPYDGDPPRRRPPPGHRRTRQPRLAASRRRRRARRPRLSRVLSAVAFGLPLNGRRVERFRFEELHMRSRPPLAIEWIGDVDGFVRMIDRTRLPGELAFISICRDVETVWGGDSLAARAGRARPLESPRRWASSAFSAHAFSRPRPMRLRKRLGEVVAYLRTSRPTAVNLFWALDRVGASRANRHLSPRDSVRRIWQEAQAIRDEDAAMCRTMGRIGGTI